MSTLAINLGGYMKTRKQKFVEYHDRYDQIPRDFTERLFFMCENYKLSQNKMFEIISKRNQMVNALCYKTLRIILYEVPEGSPRPRARLVNRYNALDLSRSNSSFIQIYSITGAADNAYMKRLVSENDYLEANQLIMTPCNVTMNCYFETPKNYNVVDTFLAEIGLHRPIKKPDWDNIGKKYSDMYNHNIWLDDDLVIDGTVRKWFSILPRVEIDLEYTNMLFNKYQYDQMKRRIPEGAELTYFGGN